MNKNFKRFIYSIIFLLFSAGSVFGWGYHTHRKITADAMRLMPESFKQKFSSQKKSFLQGCTDPDMLLKDFYNHIYYPDGSHTGGYERIQELYDKAVYLLGENKSLEKSAYILGLLSHYIADLNQPLHTAGKARDPNEDEYHSKYEREINRNLKKFELSEIQFRPIKTVKVRVQKMASEALRHYDAIGAAYRNGNRLEEVWDMTEKQIQNSVQNIVDFWSSAWQDSGHTLNNQNYMQTDLSWQTTDSADSKAESININSASAAELAAFFNISRSKARRIISGRPFRRVYDLARTKVFTPMYIQRNKDKIRLK
ncbi:MAG: zinc dependent phospholipase C family protein [Candidatus Rifleibacteriota bacterium]